MIHPRWIRLVVFLTVLLSYPIHGALAGSSLQTDSQEWNEIDLWATVSDQVNLIWVSKARFSAALKNPSVSSTGVDLDIGVGAHLIVTPSYYYAVTHAVSGQLSHRQVPILAATLKTTVGQWAMSDRNRLLGIIAPGRNYWQYRNRPRVDYLLRPESLVSSIFVWDEVSYYSDVARWSRNRLGVGAKLAVSDGWALELNYLRQDDNRSQPHVINGIQVTLIGWLWR